MTSNELLCDQTGNASLNPISRILWEVKHSLNFCRKEKLNPTKGLLILIMGIMTMVLD